MRESHRSWEEHRQTCASSLRHCRDKHTNTFFCHQSYSHTECETLGRDVLTAVCQPLSKHKEPTSFLLYSPHILSAYIKHIKATLFHFPLSLFFQRPWSVFQHVFVWSLVLVYPVHQCEQKSRCIKSPADPERHMASHMPSHCRIGGLPGPSFCLASWKMTQSRRRGKKNQGGAFLRRRN